MKCDLPLEWCQATYEACDHRCVVCGYSGPHLAAHHVIEQGRLRREYVQLDAPVTLEELLWDPDNGLLICVEPAPNRCHQRHHLAVARIPRECLRPENEAFARKYGLDHFLDRFYADREAAA